MMRNLMPTSKIVVAHSTVQPFPAAWAVLIGHSESGFSDADGFRLMDLMANRRTWGH